MGHVTIDLGAVGGGVRVGAGWVQSSSYFLPFASHTIRYSGGKSSGAKRRREQAMLRPRSSVPSASSTSSGRWASRCGHVLHYHGLD